MKQEYIHDICTINVYVCLGCIPLCPLLSRSLDGASDPPAASAADAVSAARDAISDIVHKLISYCTDSKT